MPQDQPTIDTKPLAKSKRVKLFGKGEEPLVDGKPKPCLTMPQYAVVEALIRAGDAGLSKDRLDEKSGRGDARKIMGRLAESDTDWKSVLRLPGKTGEGHRIL